MHLARWADRLEQAHGRDLAIYGHRDVGAQVVLIEQAVADAWTDLIETIDDLADGGALDLNRRFSAGEALKQSWDIDYRQSQSRWLQMASMIAAGFMGSRRMRTPAA